jgi:hypothetical protein
LTVVSIECEEYRGENCALRRTSRSRARGRKSTVETDRLGSIDKKAQNPENETRTDIESQQFQSHEMGLYCVKRRRKVYEKSL